MIKNQIEEAIEFAESDPDGGGYTLWVHFTNGEKLHLVLNTRTRPGPGAAVRERYLSLFETPDKQPVAINPDHVLYVTVEW